MKDILGWFYKGFCKLMGIEDVFLSKIDIIWHHELSDRFVDHGIYSYQNDV
jgi:hypothetical protein